MAGLEPKETGWKPIPLALKILAVVMALWMIGSLVNLPYLMANGLPLLGVFIYGPAALPVVLFLDIAGPLIFLYGLWTRKAWAVGWAFFYIGLFILNSAVALVTLRAQLGLGQILAPAIVSALFLAVIFWKRDYFTAGGPAGT